MLKTQYFSDFGSLPRRLQYVRKAVYIAIKCWSISPIIYIVMQKQNLYSEIKLHVNQAFLYIHTDFWKIDDAKTSET